MYMTVRSRRAAQRFERWTKIDLLGQDRAEIDTFTGIVDAGDHVVVDPIPLSRRPVRCGRVEQVEWQIEGKRVLLQAPAAGETGRRADPAGERQAVLALAQLTAQMHRIDLDPFGLSGRKPKPFYRAPDRQPLGPYLLCFYVHDGSVQADGAL